jgi:hypothetical protein
LGRTILWCAVGVVALSAACARQGTPPGGTPDRIPPFVISTRPDTFALVEPFTSSVRVEFNERISERVSAGSMNNAVEVSPRTGDVRVRNRRSAIDISMQGGFVEGVVYRITVLPVIRDMFNNPLPEPFEFFFSTGPDFTDNALAGVLDDRITLQPVTDARVDARPVGGDSIAYTTLSGDEGIFALRGVPEGTYDVIAYLDVNRNFEPDFTEPQALLDGQELGAADTALVFLELLAPDTTPAMLAGAEATDSATLEVGFDDYLDPDSSLAGVTVTVIADSVAPDTLTVPLVTRVLHAHAYEEYRAALADSLQAVADSLAALEAAAADTTGAAPEPPPPAEPPVEEEPALADTLPVRLAPSQMVYVLLDGPLAPEARYRATATGVTNIAGVPEGGGDIPFRGPEPPPLDTVAADSLAVDSLAVPDTTGTQRDTAAAQPDSAAAVPAVAPDTAGVARDTAAVRSDTTGVPPDTAAVQSDTSAAPPDATGVQPHTASSPPATASSPRGSARVRPAAVGASPGSASPTIRPAPGTSPLAAAVQRSRAFTAELGLRRLRD